MLGQAKKAPDRKADRWEYAPGAIFPGGKKTSDTFFESRNDRKGSFFACRNGNKLAAALRSQFPAAKIRNLDLLD